VSSVKVIVNDEEMNKLINEIGKSPIMEATLNSIARQVELEAKATAPYSNIRTPGYRHYRDSIHIETIRTEHRIVKRVVADVFHAVFVEAKTGNLARAVKKVKKGL
jgi:Bacteriophage protein of unknown function (DUF646).